MLGIIRVSGWSRVSEERWQRRWGASGLFTELYVIIVITWEL